jgi:hypothetical protein
MNPSATFPSSSLLRAAAAAFLLWGCAGTASRPAPQPPAPNAVPLEAVRPSLRTLEDSLVLDILLGYRELAAGKSDREVMRRARSAQNQLDYMLRNGGVKERGGEGRVLQIPAGEKATLGELTSQMSRELLRAPSGAAEGERAREIRRHRAELSMLAEDAEWVLALSAAQESAALPEADKRDLRRLHEAYGNRAPHSLIVPQVNALLQSDKDDRLRKELKKLANRSWERERRGGSAGASGASSPVAPPPVDSPSPSAPAPLADFDAPLAASAAPSDSAAAADTLLSPDRFCEERRAEAADTFASARAATGEARAALLRRSLAALDECLARYPGTPAAEKARGNRDRVEKELKPR